MAVSGLPPPGAAPLLGTPQPPHERILVSKVLTYSDVSTEVARTGRIVLPRIQVQQCLPELLRLCRAEGALPALRSGGPVKLSVDLVVEDEAGRTWVLLMKTWQNVVSGEHRPTFVLENTADFVRANGLVQGHTLAFCPVGGRMLLRTSLRADQLLPRQPKRAGGGAGAPAPKRRPPPARASAWELPASAFAAPPVSSAGRGRREPAAHQPPTPEHLPVWGAPPPGCNAEEAAAALLHMHDGSRESSLSEQLAGPSRGGSPRGAPAPLVLRPQPVHGGVQPPAPLAQLEAQLAALRAALAPAPAPPPPPQQELPAELLAQAQRVLAAVLAQREQERRYADQCNRALLLQALQQRLAGAQAPAQAQAQPAQPQLFAPPTFGGLLA